MANKGRLAFRSWYYLRQGYSIYLALTLAGVNTLVSVYYLAINNLPSLKAIFPDFTTWALVMVGTMVPFAVFLGWLHIKRSRAFSSEVEITYEANPFLYKLPPGYTKEVVYPMYLEILKMNLKILSGDALTEQDRKQVTELQQRIENLINGGVEGWPEGKAVPASLRKGGQPKIKTTEPNSSVLLQGDNLK